MLLFSELLLIQVENSTIKIWQQNHIYAGYCHARLKTTHYDGF